MRKLFTVHEEGWLSSSNRDELKLNSDSYYILLGSTYFRAAIFKNDQNPRVITKKHN